MTSTKERVREEELLDQASDEIAERNLADIARINSWTGASGEMCRQLGRTFKQQDAFSFLDVGCASGDLARAVQRRFPQSLTICLDLMGRNLNRAPVPKLQGNVFQLPFRDSSVDVLHCSLFLHHFSEEECVSILHEMRRVAKKLVLVQDLHRHPVSYYFLPMTKLLLRWEDITVSDGMKSVAAGWRKPEIEALLQSAGCAESSRIQWHFPSFRYFIAIKTHQ